MLNEWPQGAPRLLYRYRNLCIGSVAYELHVQICFTGSAGELPCEGSCLKRVNLVCNLVQRAYEAGENYGLKITRLRECIAWPDEEYQITSDTSDHCTDH